MEGEVREADPPAIGRTAAASPPDDPSELTVASDLFLSVRSAVLRVVREPMKAAEVARRLDVTETQARKWLTRLVSEGVLEKNTKPVRYSLRPINLFGPEGPNGPGATKERRGSGK
jgi:hypothetical protein